MDRKNILGWEEDLPSFASNWIFIAQQSHIKNGNILLSIDDILTSWKSLFHLKSIQNIGVKVNAYNCTLSNLKFLELLMIQSNYFEFNLMLNEKTDDIESIQAANDKVI